MKSILFYLIPLAIFVAINNFIDNLFWPYYIVLLLAFLAFQLARLRYPKNELPMTAKLAQAAFYILTVAVIFRDQFLSVSVINILLGLTLGLVIVDLLVSKKQPSS